jgi:hydrogenase 3 maturation protease
LLNDIETELKGWFFGAKKVVIAGIGDSLRSDDNIGPKIVEALQRKVRSEVLLLECETVPESYILDIEQFRPSHVLLIDAAEMNLEPGSAKIVGAETIPKTSAVSSHVLPLSVFCEYLQKATSAKIALLLVQPKSMDLEEGLTPEVQASADVLIKILANLLQ